MRQANLEELDIGVRMGGRKINNLRYADDTTLLAESKEELLQLVTSVIEKSAQAGLDLNLKKTKIMSTEEIEEFEVDGEKIGVVRDFIFLGAKIEDSGSCKGEILRRLALGVTKKMFVSGYPTDPNFYMPTLIFFLDKHIFSTSVMDKKM